VVLNEIHLRRGGRSKDQVVGGDAGGTVGFRTVVVMAEEAAPHGGEWAEREHTPSIVLPADARLRSWLAGDYGGFD
jgi:hypothetical protein